MSLEMDIRYADHPDPARRFTTEEMRDKFLISRPFVPGAISLVYSHVDRIIAGGITPLADPLNLEAGRELGVEYFLERREMGVINIGGAGSITLDGKVHKVGPREGMYIGLGTKEVSFASADPARPSTSTAVSAEMRSGYRSPTCRRRANPVLVDRVAVMTLSFVQSLRRPIRSGLLGT